jgi:tripartite ATP-independent transporter DctM subunit
MPVLLLLGIMLLLSLAGVPLVFSILAASLVTLFAFRPTIPLEVVPELFVSGIDTSLLLAVVFFFLSGELMNRGGVTRRLVDFANALVGRIRGGLGHVNVVSSIFFSGITGSAVADTAAIGTIMIPSMVEKGYSRGFSAAVTASSSVIGPIIPPSIPVLIYAVLASVSVGRMFLAGILPGLLIGLCLMVAVYAISRRRGYPREAGMSLGMIVRRGVDAVGALVAPVIIVGGILGGVFTATEAGAVAAAYSCIAGVFIYRELTWSGFWQAMLNAAEGTATVLVILGASSIFAWLVADMQVNRTIAAAIFSITDSPWAVLLLINAFVLLIGLIMDPLAAMVILVPILLPTVTQLGIDPIHFGIIIVINLMIGLCTPPVGYLIFLAARIADTRPEIVIRELLPFLGALLMALLLVTYVPAFTLTLPKLMD